MKKLNVKKDDTVVIISGKDKGKKGKIMVAFPQAERVIVQNANMITRHVKPRRQGEQGGRIEKEGTIHASNVMLVCPKCVKATRVGHRIEVVTGKDGKQKNKNIRVCKKCKQDID